ncbi:penicillin acylase family protein [Larkinella soli]|uniref:penicillin acylase family protein n=1 Tax=Larkinella soli TaxID=1770527 RepID=UPI000FFC8D7D|nr:penicillin acylase family protein [Larkinella soli]
MRLIILVLIGGLLVFSGPFSCRQQAETFRTPGLQKPVEILRDRWGIAHIYAQNEHDLFFAQGYNVASDRLFQLELFRRQATGTIAELLGPRELKRDIGTRLFQFRGNLDEEMKHYHPRGPQIIRAFVEGINAYIRQVSRTPEKLPIEFQLLKTRPGLWTPEVVISRHQGLLYNVREELDYGRLVHLIGPDRLRDLEWFQPAAGQKDPDLTLHVAGEPLFQPILDLYDAFRLPLKFSPEDKGLGATEEEALWKPADADAWFENERHFVGSNNWVVSGGRSQSGFPMLANDPHRVQAVPSLRYWVHLVAPGWNVIGAGEPVLPGVSIGHNEYGAWGLTIFETDNEDLYVYETRPGYPAQYRYGNGWEAVKEVRDTIRVKEKAPVVVSLKYTRHGPVVYEDAKNRLLFAVRAGWLETGCAPYLASLRINQARNWEEFRRACAYSRLPGENMIWADKTGTVGWQAVGLSPIRPSVPGRAWPGLLPVPGDGRFEWAGYLPIRDLPHTVDPKEGFFATANNNLIPKGFSHRDAVGWSWSSPMRADRINAVLASRPKHSLDDLKALQTDYYTPLADRLVPLLQPLRGRPEAVGWARQQLLGWDRKLAVSSVPASVYVAWEEQLRAAVYHLSVPETARPYLKSIPTERMLDWITNNRVPGFPDRNRLLLLGLEYAMADLKERLGPDRSRWQYGQEANKHLRLTHALSAFMTPEQKALTSVGPAPRGGYAETVNSTGHALNQEHGASFRLLVDTGDWDRALGINNPGQSGDPRSPHYRDLFPIWARDEYIPVYFTKEKIRTVTEKRLVLDPK